MMDELLHGFEELRYEPEDHSPLHGGRIELDAELWHIWSSRGGLLSRMEIHPSRRSALAADQPS
jgi:hypothetical protein